MVSQNASLPDLGTLAKEHRGSLAMWLFMPVGLFFLLVALFYAYVTISSRAWIGAIVVIILLLLAAPFLLLWYRSLKTRVCLFEHGFTVTKGKQTSIVRWGEIEAIWQSATRYRVNFIPVATFHTYTVQTSDGTRLKLGNGVGNIKQLGDAIQAQTLRSMWPRAIETYNSGGTLQFDRLSISQAGISNGKETIAWSQVKDVQVWRGYLKIQKEGKWLRWTSIRVARVPNFWLFTNLVEYILRTRG